MVVVRVVYTRSTRHTGLGKEWPCVLTSRLTPPFSTHPHLSPHHQPSPPLPTPLNPLYPSPALHPSHTTRDTRHHTPSIPSHSTHPQICPNPHPPSHKNHPPFLSLLSPPPFPPPTLFFLLLLLPKTNFIFIRSKHTLTLFHPMLYDTVPPP